MLERKVPYMKRSIALLIVLMFCLGGAYADTRDSWAIQSYAPRWALRSYVPTEEELFEDFGSFTYLSTDSYDGRYRAELNIERREGDLATTVYVYITDTQSGKTTAVIRTDRAYDFWGICWDKSSYDIYVQSSDIGIYTLICTGGTWQKDLETGIPDYIVSRVDIIRMRQRIEDMIGKTPDELDQEYSDHLKDFQLGYIRCEDGFIEYEHSWRYPYTIIAAAGFSSSGVLLYNEGLNLLSAELFDGCSPTSYKELVEAFGYGFDSGASGFWSMSYLIDDGRTVVYNMISDGVDHDWKIQAFVTNITDWDEFIGEHSDEPY